MGSSYSTGGLCVQSLFNRMKTGPEGCWGWGWGSYKASGSRKNPVFVPSCPQRDREHLQSTWRWYALVIWCPQTLPILISSWRPV